jgi:hypothetical protein
MAHIKLPTKKMKYEFPIPKIIILPATIIVPIKILKFLFIKSLNAPHGIVNMKKNIE